ncbi:MAG: putative peptide maturation dehydrogenase [Solirubrobacterales bacterium]|nr:putative peptide maturation dehydrogenase [Solirubrobacterales bacterium]
MAQIRRTPYACFYFEDEPPSDIAALLAGRLPQQGEARIVGLAILDGQRHRIDRAELEALLSTPADRWVDTGGVDMGVVRALCAKGLLLIDDDEPAFKALRARDEMLRDTEWNFYAALYHYMTRWTGVEMAEGEAEPADIDLSSKAAARAHLAEHGSPPAEFAEPHAGVEVSLPGHPRDGGLYRSLLARRTTRAFDPSDPMTLDELDVVLRYVFGCHGYARNAAGVVCIKRTSPSGGGLHPIEAYPIVTNVAGVEPGIYHYDARDHSLVRLEDIAQEEAGALATFFLCGQKYFGMAHVSFILTARFYRNHWKYRRHQKAYAGILMDAAHLSQTLYLVGAELNLGTYVTIAINAGDIEQRLGIDGVSEGVIAMIGCGRRVPGRSPLELQFSGDVTG